MGNNDIWLSVDRAHERQEEADEAFDEAVAAAAREHAAAIRKNITAGHRQTLSALAEDVAHRMSMPDVMEHMVRIAAIGGPLAVGHLYCDLLQKGIDFEAEVQGKKEVERTFRVPA